MKKSTEPAHKKSTSSPSSNESTKCQSKKPTDGHVWNLENAAAFLEGYSGIAETMRMEPMGAWEAMMDNYAPDILKSRQDRGLSVEEVAEQTGLPKEEIAFAEKKCPETIPLTYVFLEAFYSERKSEDWIAKMAKRVMAYKEENEALKERMKAVAKDFDERFAREQTYMLIQRLQYLPYDMVNNNNA